MFNFSPPTLLGKDPNAWLDPCPVNGNDMNYVLFKVMFLPSLNFGEDCKDFPTIPIFTRTNALPLGRLNNALLIL